MVSPRHPLAQRKRVRMVELHRQGLVLLPRDFATRTMLDECFRSCGAEPVVAAEMNTIAPMVGLVARTQLAAIVSSHAVSRAMTVRVIPMESPTPVRTPGMLWKRDTRQSPAVRSFAVDHPQAGAWAQLAGSSVNGHIGRAPPRLVRASGAAWARRAPAGFR